MYMYVESVCCIRLIFLTVLWDELFHSGESNLLLKLSMFDLIRNKQWLLCAQDYLNPCIVEIFLFSNIPFFHLSVVM